jgi:hypothetical protein
VGGVAREQSFAAADQSAWVAACRSFVNTVLAKPDVILASLDDKVPQLLSAPVFSIDEKWVQKCDSVVGGF